ncbi:MAG: hypothetical protein EOO29_19315 [Comamonadaceae bacterium]|nr:MAG: hypothetical protein EOO29_19315 [Comamonadaceae bacterium]
MTPNPPTKHIGSGATFIPDPPGPDDDRFARAFKPWREWNVAVNFLTNLHCGADESSVFCLAMDPPDVVFSSARFEVKEILDPGRRRHDEVKAAKAKKGPPARDRARLYTPKDLTPEGVAVLVDQELQQMAGRGRYTESQRREMDLLFYVNMLQHWFEHGEMPSPQSFEAYGWRSVSAVVSTQTSIVFHANADAPSFLVENAGVVRCRFEPLD